jgi:hypothetical protein
MSTILCIILNHKRRYQSFKPTAIFVILPTRYWELVPQHTNPKAPELENYKIKQCLSDKTLDPYIRRLELNPRCEMQTL